MRVKILFLVSLVAACNTNQGGSNDAAIGKDTAKSYSVDSPRKPSANPVAPKTYSNQRFRDVSAEQKSEHTFEVNGKAQVFEASFGWIIEDGHEELQRGYAMTDAGAPEWGNFSFTVTAPKQRPNSTLHIVLFESSAKDGSRQYELPVLLY
jgi:predicted small secreted protein